MATRERPIRGFLKSQVSTNLRAGLGGPGPPAGGPGGVRPGRSPAAVTVSAVEAGPGLRPTRTWKGRPTRDSEIVSQGAPFKSSRRRVLDS